jgi:hypothetical protein
VQGIDVFLSSRPTLDNNSLPRSPCRLTPRLTLFDHYASGCDNRQCFRHQQHRAGSTTLTAFVALDLASWSIVRSSLWNCSNRVESRWPPPTTGWSVSSTKHRSMFNVANCSCSRFCMASVYLLMIVLPEVETRCWQCPEHRIEIKVPRCSLKTLQYDREPIHVMSCPAASFRFRFPVSSRRLICIWSFFLTYESCDHDNRLTSI